MINWLKNIKTLNLTLSDYALIWIVFFSIFYQKLAPVGFIFWILISILVWKKISLFELFKKTFFGNKKWFLAYYFLLIMGMIWSENTAFGLSKLENKLTFLLFPILFSNSEITISIQTFKKLFTVALVLTLFSLEIFALFRALFFESSNAAAYFHDPYFCIIMHRSYFACYLVIGIIMVLSEFKKNNNNWYIFLVLFFSLGVLQTGSKAGVISLIIVFVLFTFTQLITNNKKLSFLTIICLTLVFSVLLINRERGKSRFFTLFSALESTKLSNNPSVESNAARLMIWNSSLDVWKENLIFGTGTGDYDDILTLKNLTKGNHGIAKQRLNSHNQFLNSGVQLGIFGFIILVMIFISSILTYPTSIWRISILIVFFINFMVESFLETQAGIVLFCILCVFLFDSEKKQTKFN